MSERCSRRVLFRSSFRNDLGLPSMSRTWIDRSSSFNARPRMVCPRLVSTTTVKYSLEISASGSTSASRNDFADRVIPIAPKSGPRLAPRSPMEWQAAHPPLPSNMTLPAEALPVIFAGPLCPTRGSISPKPTLNTLVKAECDDQVPGRNGNHLFSVREIADGRCENRPVSGESPQPFARGGVQSEDHTFERPSKYQVSAGRHHAPQGGVRTLCSHLMPPVPGSIAMTLPQLSSGAPIF